MIDGSVERFGLHPCGAQCLARRRGGGQRQGKEQPFDGDEAVACLGRDLFGGIKQAHGVIVEAGGLLRAGAGDGRHFGQCRVGFAQRGGRVAASGLDEAGRHALLILQQRFQQMFRADPLMAHADRDGLRRLQEAFGAVSEFFEVHKMPFV